MKWIQKISNYIKIHVFGFCEPRHKEDKVFYNDKNQYHRDDGPAIEYSNGNKYWYQQGQLHREDGPAVESADGTQQWWFKGKQLNVSSQEEFIRHLKLKAFW